MISGLSLFMTAFLAATILPLSSEVVLVGLTSADGILAGWFLFLASLGNTLGACINWLLGRFFLHWQARSWFPVSHEKLQKSSELYHRFGLWSLLFAWLPVIGDPLTLVAGMLQVRFAVFLPLVAIGKTARYAVLVELTLHATG